MVRQRTGLHKTDRLGSGIRGGVDRSKISSERNFDGEEFTAYGAYKSKKVAERVALRLRRQGHMARVVYGKRAKGYTTYVKTRPSR
jgi:hypothetical protein